MTMLGERGAGRPVAVVAGTGGHGGGGICAARHLANHGADVTLVVSDSRRLTGAPAQQLALYRATNGRIVDQRDLSSLQPASRWTRCSATASRARRAAWPTT